MKVAWALRSILPAAVVSFFEALVLEGDKDDPTSSAPPGLLDSAILPRSIGALRRKEQRLLRRGHDSRESERHQETERRWF